MQQGGLISDLEFQPRYDLVVNGQRVCGYVADWRYINNGQTIVEDRKSPITRTPLYRLKAKLMRACYGIVILETLKSR